MGRGRTRMNTDTEKQWATNKHEWTRIQLEALQGLIQRVRETVERYSMLAAGMRVGVAVSGGADSVCLLYVLRELAAEWRLCLTVLHLDHQLRGAESRADAEFVARMAVELGVAVMARAVELPAGNVEEAAREARLAFFREAIASGAVDRVATGHTRSDQAETVLFRFLRGAGTAGLSGIRPVTPEGIVRPLIDVERAEVEAFLRERGIAWREDSTNANRRFARNRIRHELLPQLAREWNPEVAATLARTADWALAEESYWEAEVDRLAADRLREEGGAVLVEASAIAELPAAVARRLVRRAIEQAKGDLRGIDFRHVDEVLRIAAREAGCGRTQAHGLDICRSFDQIRFGCPARSDGYEVAAPVPGVAAIPGGAGISLELIEKSETSATEDYVYNGVMGWVDWTRVSGSLQLRNWRPGDRYHPVGRGGIQKLKSLFQIARIRVWERSQWPVLVAGASIVWTRRFGVAAEAAAGPATRTVLLIREAGE